MEIAHVVGRYAPVGGMETYVWELTRAQAAAGWKVSVLCAGCEVADVGAVRVIPLGSPRSRRGWIWLLAFSRRVASWLSMHPSADRIVHSHLRLGVHHVTTFHATPFLHPRKGPGLSILSPRVFAQLHMERRELLAPSVQAVVPVSGLIGRLLAERYPRARITGPVSPGTKQVTPRPFHRVDPAGGRVGFIGREWKRKGLPFALRVLEILRARRPSLEFIVYGPGQEELHSLFRNTGVRYRLGGWADTGNVYRDLDLLLHPAEREAFGMVLTEALAAGVPVVASSECGAADIVGGQGGSVLRLDAPAEAWSAACDRQLARDAPLPPYRRSAQDVHADYERIYRRVAASRG